MKPPITAVCFLALCFALIGCSKEREISGEIFSNDPKKGIVKQAGTVIYFLTPSEHEGFQAIAKESRDRKYEQDRRLWETSSKKYGKIFDKYKRDDGKVYKSDAGEEDFEKLKTLESVISEAKTNIEGRVYDQELTFDEYTRAQLKDFVTTVKQSTANSQGSFKVIVSIGSEYWVLAEAVIEPKSRWLFRWVPDGTPLVLSDGNAKMD